MASHLLRGTLIFKTLVDSEALLPEKTAKGPLDSSSYKWLFGAARWPVRGVDKVGFEEGGGKDSSHVVVIRGGRFWRLECKDENGEWLSERELRE